MPAECSFQILGHYCKLALWMIPWYLAITKKTIAAIQVQLQNIASQVIGAYGCNVGKTIINHPFFDGLHHPSVVILGMVVYCFNHIRYLVDTANSAPTTSPSRCRQALARTSRGWTRRRPAWERGSFLAKIAWSGLRSLRKIYSQ